MSEEFKDEMIQSHEEVTENLLEKAKQRVAKIQQISKDPQYDQYLRQLQIDLERGKATPEQILREAERTFHIYKQRFPEYIGEDEGQTRKQSITGMEFKIGAGVTGILGVLLLMMSLITFGANFLSDTMQTVAAMVLTVIIAVFSLLLSKRKNSATIKIISILGCYLCFLPINDFTNNLQFLIIISILFLINILNVFISVDKYPQVINGIHMGLNTLFAVILSIAALGNKIDAIYIILYLITSVIVLNMAIWKWEGSHVSAVLYIIETVICLFMLLIISLGDFYPYQGRDYAFIDQYIMLMLLMAVCIFFFIFHHAKHLKWVQYYFFMSMAFITLADADVRTGMIGILMLFIICKIVSGIKELSVMEIILTVVAFFAISSNVPNQITRNNLDIMILIGFLAAAMIFSAFRIKRWQLFYELMITASLMGIFPQDHGRAQATFADVCVLFILMILFNHLPYLRRRTLENIENGKTNTQKIYNIINIVLLVLNSSIVLVSGSLILASVVLVINALAVMVFFGERYFMKMPKKYVVLAIYLTLMIFMVPYHNAVITNILLILIAVACVILGIKLKDKAQRLCGLVLALFVCLKFILFDIRNMDSMPRIIISLVTGIVILIISFIYIQLEKKEKLEGNRE